MVKLAAVLVLLVGCLRVESSGNAGGLAYGEFQKCEVVLYGCDIEYQSEDTECTDDVDVLESGLAFDCREQAIENGCPATAFCVAECSGTYNACLFIDSGEESEE